MIYNLMFDTQIELNIAQLLTDGFLLLLVSPVSRSASGCFMHGSSNRAYFKQFGINCFLKQAIYNKKMRAQQQHLKCRRGLTSFIVTVFIVSFISLMWYVFQFVDTKGVMDRINMNICSITCGSSYMFQFNGYQCCTDDMHLVCVFKQVCRQAQLKPLQDSYDQYLIYIVLLASTEALLIAIVVFIQCRGRRGGRGRRQQALRPPIDAYAYNNLVNALFSANQNRMELDYQSFAHNDLENACAVCLQAFKQERAIKLKCGHIFHSKCIKDWSRRKKTCPVCRASQ